MTSNTSKPKPAWQNYVADFANMLKAFIGSNYLTVSYAFLQSGLGLGFGGLLMIALVTDHCCHLIVKTKYHAIRHVIELYKASTESSNGASSSAGDNDAELFSDDEDDDIVIYDVDEASMIEQHMLKHMSYGDIGQISMGKVGRIIVNFCIAMTQFCFCVNYSIFLGNTVYSLFPSNVCYNGIVNVDNVSYVAKIEPYCELRYLGLVPSTIIKPTKRSIGTDFTNSSLLGVLPGKNDTDTSDTPLTNLNGSVTSAFFENISTSTEMPFANATSMAMSNITGEVIQSTAPDLKLLVLAPLPFFLLFALFRNVRKLGFISVIANASILLGSASVFLYLIVDFQIHDTIIWTKWEGLPIFFGMVTAAFEGIGLIIPVESSMEGNRHNFAAFLHGAIGVLGVILGGFGVMGYLRFGEELNQMLNTNIPASSWVSVAVNICAILGVLLTFPLQIYPVIEMCEIFLFSEGALCGPKKRSSSLLSEEDEEEAEGKESLLPDASDKSYTALPVSVAAHIPKSVPAWKRNILRMLIVLSSTGLAIIFRNSFALVAAFTGAIGSSLLAYILPCLFHLKLCHRDLPWLVCFKDTVIIMLGILCSIVSLYSVIIQLVKNTSV